MKRRTDEDAPCYQRSHTFSTSFEDKTWFESSFQYILVVLKQHAFFTSFTEQARLQDVAKSGLASKPGANGFLVVVQPQLDVS